MHSANIFGEPSYTPKEMEVTGIQANDIGKNACQKTEQKDEHFSETSSGG